MSTLFLSLIFPSFSLCCSLCLISLYPILNHYIILPPISPLSFYFSFNVYTPNPLLFYPIPYSLTQLPYSLTQSPYSLTQFLIPYPLSLNPLSLTPLPLILLSCLKSYSCFFLITKYLNVKLFLNFFLLSSLPWIVGQIIIMYHF